MVVFLAALLLALPAIQPASANDTHACTLLPSEKSEDLPVREVISDQVFDDLIGWLAIHTAYDLKLTYQLPPSVSFCVVGEIIAYEDHELIVEKELRAAFDYPHRRIFLVRPWSKDDLFDLSVLLHELIHDVQLHNRDWECAGAPELEAYRLQDKWLRSHGIAHAFDWKVILHLSKCSGENAPD